MLSGTQIERYSRQIILPQVGGVGQERLLAASLTVWGTGDLARIAALYLAAAGVGALRLAAELRGDIEGLNPDCRVGEIGISVREINAAAALDASDAVLAAGADEHTCRLLNEAALTHHLPLLWGDATERMGWFAVLSHPAIESACYECRPRPADPGGAAHGAAAGVPGAFIGAVMATEAIKVILGVGTVAAGRMLVYDALAQSVGVVPLARAPECAACRMWRVARSGSGDRGA